MSSAKRTKMNAAQSRKTIGIILRYLKKYKVLFALTLVINLLQVGATLCIPVLVGRAIDMAVGKGNVDFEGIFKILVTIGIIAAADVLLQWLINVCNNRIAFGTARRLRRDAFAKIQRLPLSYIDARPVGDTVSRVVSDVDQFCDGLLMGFSRFFSGVLTILGTLALMLWLNPIIAAVVVVATPLSLFVASFIAKSSVPHRK